MICRDTSTVLRHTMNLLPFFQGRRFVFQIIYVPVVHTDYQIKIIKIFRTDRTRTMYQFDNRDEPREHASDYPVIHPDDKTRFRQNLSQTLSPVLLLFIKWSITPSAVELRQIFPKQTNNIFFIFITLGLHHNKLSKIYGVRLRSFPSECVVEAPVHVPSGHSAQSWRRSSW